MGGTMKGGAKSRCEGFAPGGVASPTLPSENLDVSSPLSDAGKKPMDTSQVNKTGQGDPVPRLCHKWRQQRKWWRAGAMAGETKVFGKVER